MTSYPRTLNQQIKGPLAVHKFKFYVTDPATGKREVKEIGG